jgi:cytochrome bd-type quinol oxidase subunit 2
MGSESLLGVGLLLAFCAGACGVARRSASSELRRNTLSVALVVLGLLAAFFLFFGAGTLMRGLKAQPKTQGQLIAPQARFASAASVEWPIRQAPSAVVGRPLIQRSLS